MGEGPIGTIPWPIHGFFEDLKWLYGFLCAFDFFEVLKTKTKIRGGGVSVLGGTNPAGIRDNARKASRDSR